MNKLIREIPLDNGLTVRFFDSTRRYFGDYNQVRVRIQCEVPLTEELFEDAQSYQAALKTLGARADYSKEIEQQGVPSAEIDAAIEKVVQHFVDHSLAYFNNAAFAKKLVQSELGRVKGKGKSFIVRAFHD